MKFYYVYILHSIPYPDSFYTGFTENIEQRLHEHNQGKCSHTSKHKPWQIKTAIAFNDRKKALDFERYLKNCIRAGVYEETVVRKYFYNQGIEVNYISLGSL